MNFSKNRFIFGLIGSLLLMVIVVKYGYMVFSSHSQFSTTGLIGLSALLMVAFVLLVRFFCFAYRGASRASEQERDALR